MQEKIKPMSDKQAKMYALIEEWLASGQNREDFCNSHHLTLSTFAYWRSKYLKHHISFEKDDSNFVRLQPEQTGSGIELRYPNGVVLHIPSWSPSEVKALIGLV